MEDGTNKYITESLQGQISVREFLEREAALKNSLRSELDLSTKTSSRHRVWFGFWWKALPALAVIIAAVLFIGVKVTSPRSAQEEIDATLQALDAHLIGLGDIDTSARQLDYLWDEV